MTAIATTTPREVDTALAAKYHEIDAAMHQLSLVSSTAKRLADAKFYYRGKHYVTDMTLDEALEILAQQVERIAAYKASHVRVDGDYTGTDWSEWSGSPAPYDNDKPAEYIAKVNELTKQVSTLRDEARELNAAYTGWSRFFLVTSSAGHVHSSMGCSTCRPTTAYGWMPELSGKTEATAVSELGPNLCSVCFPSAPVDHQGGKLTKAQAAKLAA